MTTLRPETSGPLVDRRPNLDHSPGQGEGPELSVIIIGRNEETRIERCFRTVLASLEGLDNYEVIYVDSASQDNTVAIAKRFPIRILQLKPDWSLSPSAGRYIGYLNSKGKYLMFVDGDTMLYKRWTKTGLNFLKSEPSHGGVAGIVHELVQDRDGTCIGVQKDKYSVADAASPQAALSFGGIAMYCREAMQKAGTFNPYLKTGEEGEVALRIRNAGYALTWLNTPMCLTYAPPRESFGELYRRSRTCLYEYGPAIRYCMANKNALRYLREQMWYVCTFVAAIVVCMLMILAGVLSGRIWPFALVAGAAGILVFLKKKSPKFLLVSILKRSLTTYKTAVSFWTFRALPVESYPTDAVVVK